ncbi:hypothetical protein EYC84_011172 [Monilinia fructicola]|uniref:Elongation of fatty acids protein n=1 Tax=Monilinia fructicola TaxID=38448 RepID=A0A5M9J993_MONFR|nr:hypothetical protein EYC84_011172 [Monilinia fructicola]
MSSSIPFLPPVGAVKFSPWEAFDRVWTSAVGYPAEEFKFIPARLQWLHYEKLLRWTKPLVTLYYLNYITKYVELLDTVFLFLKKKPLTFLHCYHHPATALLCYTQLSARGIRITWKEWITRLQIAQFVLDLIAIYFATYSYWASAYHPSLPHVGTCAGESYAAFAGCTIISSYLFLFISFYFATYKTTVKRTTIKPQDIKSGGKS